MRRRPIRGALVVLLAVVLALAAGCEHRAQDAPAADAPAARLVATDGFGATVLLDRRVAPDQSAMRALRGATDVRTTYAGAFVQEMLGRDGDAGARRDWLLYVDGIGSSVGAKDVDVEDGMAMWWDFRPWSSVSRTTSVVGLWPRPFAGDDARERRVSADAPLDAPLRAAGARLVDDPSAPWRVRVGDDADLQRRDPAWRAARRDPEAAGLTITIDRGAVVALDPVRTRWEPVPAARALVAAVPTGIQPEDGMLLVAAGLDAGAARAAAERVARDPGVLALRYAVAFDGAGVPLRAGGRSGA
ncbi:MAG: DUF4430 domain-containing protein [Thermoleophilia bacterium]